MSNRNLLTRRAFVTQSTAAVLMASSTVCVPAFCSDRRSADKLNIGVIGTCNRGGANLSGVSSENIIALCDVDSNYLDRASQPYPNAQKFADFRKMLEQCESNLDAIVVSTPDHTHAPAAAMGMRMDKHCYCEKPLTHEVREARVLQQIASEKKLVTQMGTQIHAGDNYRRVVELVQSGAIGKVEEVHTWFAGVGAINTSRPTNTPEVPASLDWDLWLGPAPARPYHPCYHPGSWRRWWDFGTGTMGDFACHHMDLPFWALKLKDCLTVEAVGPELNLEGTPHYLTVKYTFPARETLPPVALTWYNGIMPEILKQKGIENAPSAGNLFIGSEGMIVADYSMHKLYPEQKYADFVRPEQFIAQSIGHHQEWIKACKENQPEAPTCKFGYSGRLTETVLLGCLSFRAGEKLVWDAENMKITNVESANDLLSRQYREGWKL